MTTLQQIFLISGSLLGFLGVAAGAFGAHLLKSKLSIASFDIYEVAVRYQMYHALAMIALVGIMHVMPSTWLLISGIFWLLGIIVFSGSLYLFVFTEIRAWGAITPIGGVFLLIGWLCLFFGGITQ